MEKAKREVKVSMNVNVSDEDIEDIVVTAIEGGIGYWACLDNSGERWIDTPKDESYAETATKILLEGDGVTFLDDEDHDTSWVLTLEKLMKGIEMYLNSDRGLGCLDGSNVSVVIDTCQIDAEAADMIVQYALFGELIYG